MTTDPTFLSIAELGAGYRQGALSPVEVTEAVFARIASRNPALNAYFHLGQETALASAAASAQRYRAGTPLSPLDGVPFSVKDHILTADMPGPWGVKGPAPLPGIDAPVVARLREAGAILIGKTTQPELAMFCSGISGRYGIARNPWNLERSPGGSSAGAAAAVASGMGALAIGSDAGGSIRIPASYCGVAGHKPTFGRVPFFPPFGPGPVMGPLARSVEDLAQSMNVITRPDWRDIYALPADGVDYVAGLAARPQGLRIAYSEAFGFGLPATPEVSALVRRTLAFFESLGATVTEIPPFFDYDLYDRLAPATFAGLRGLVAGVLGSLDRLSELLPEIQTAFERSASVTLDEFLGAKMLEPQAALQVAQSLKDFDFLITPTMPTTAFAADRCFPPEAKPGRYGYTFDMNPYTWLFNVTLQPATSVPCGIASDGLPVGVQIVGPRGADLQCLQLAAAYERARGALPLPPLVRP